MLGCSGNGLAGSFGAGVLDGLLDNRDRGRRFRRADFFVSHAMGFSREISQIIKFCPANLASSDHGNSRESGARGWEDAFNANAKGNFTHGDCVAWAGASHFHKSAFKCLHAFGALFHGFKQDAHRVADF